MEESGRHATVTLDIQGLGILLYSPKNAEHIAADQDYFSSSYDTAENVRAHIQAGTIVSFGTGSSGIFILDCYQTPPDSALLESSEFVLRLGVRCVGGEVRFRDLYDLMEWEPDCPADQVYRLPDGVYRVTLCSDSPPSGVIGDHQTITVFFEQVSEIPRLEGEGIPMLCM